MKRVLIIAILFIAVVGGVLAWEFIHGTKTVNDQPEIIHIPTGASFEQVIDTLTSRKLIENESYFSMLADYMKYVKPEMRPGRFEITPGMSYVGLIRKLRNGKQSPLMVVLTTERLPEDVAKKVARFIEADSAQVFKTITDTTLLAKYGKNQETAMTLMIPNSYEFFWTTTPEQFLERMHKESTKFWATNDRLAKAKALNMTPEEVYTLASIVEKETNQNSEKPRMAGVYLNRLKSDWLLQADPTCVFARRDFAAKRVTDYHLKFDSPYNTYLYTGLPPGPIAMSSIASIDAVLNSEDHEFFYFCAKGDDSGLHSFAKTLAGHNQNAKLYYQRMRASGYWD